MEEPKVLKDRFRARQPLPRLPLRPRQLFAGQSAGWQPPPCPARPAGPWPSWRQRRAGRAGADSGRLPRFWPISANFRTDFPEESVKLAQEKAQEKAQKKHKKKHQKKQRKTPITLQRDPATTFHHGKPPAGAQKKAPRNPQEKAQQKAQSGAQKKAPQNPNYHPPGLRYYFFFITGNHQREHKKKHHGTHKKKHKGPPQNPNYHPLRLRYYFSSRETTSGSTQKSTTEPTRKSTKDHRKTPIGAQKKAPQNLAGGPVFQYCFPFRPRNSNYLPQDPPQASPGHHKN